MRLHTVEELGFGSAAWQSGEATSSGSRPICQWCCCLSPVRSMVPSFVRHTLVNDRSGNSKEYLFARFGRCLQQKGNSNCQVNRTNLRLRNRPRPKSRVSSTGGRNGKGCVWRTGQFWRLMQAASILEPERSMWPYLQIGMRIRCACTKPSRKISRKLADWLVRCGITTVAMESRGVKSCLVNARHMKNVPGRRTDWYECQWLQFLHSVGLLRPAFRPEADVTSVRTVMRHRNDLVQMASQHVQHMQKALTQMNLQIQHVISDITGTTGLAIVDAILDGRRDPAELAKLRDPRIRASEETIQKSLVGNCTGPISSRLSSAIKKSRSGSEDLSHGWTRRKRPYRRTASVTAGPRRNGRKAASRK